MQPNAIIAMAAAALKGLGLSGITTPPTAPRRGGTQRTRGGKHAGGTLTARQHLHRDRLEGREPFGLTSSGIRRAPVSKAGWR